MPKAFDRCFFKVMRKPGPPPPVYALISTRYFVLFKFKIDLPPEVSGWLMLRRAALTTKLQVMVQTHRLGQSRACIVFAVWTGSPSCRSTRDSGKLKMIPRPGLKTTTVLLVRHLYYATFLTLMWRMQGKGKKRKSGIIAGHVRTRSILRRHHYQLTLIPHARYD